MTFAIVGTLTVVFSLVINYWRGFELERARWRLLELRDGLRRRAIIDPQFARSPNFLHLDSSLTSFQRQSHVISVWHLIAAAVIKPQVGRELVYKPGLTTKPRGNELGGDKDCDHVFLASGIQLIKILALRHIVLVVLLALPAAATVLVMAFLRRSRTMRSAASEYKFLLPKERNRLLKFATTIAGMPAAFAVGSRSPARKPATA